MSAVFAYYAKMFSLSNRLDCVANIAKSGSRLNLPDSGQQCFVCRLHQAPSQHTGGADEVHATGVAEPAILDNGDINVDDVRILSAEGMP